jgi:hypothetical protein
MKRIPGSSPCLACRFARERIARGFLRVSKRLFRLPLLPVGLAPDAFAQVKIHCRVRGGSENAEPQRGSPNRRYRDSHK